MKLNLGCGKEWKLDGWYTLDHKSNGMRQQAWNLPFKNDFFDVVYCSHLVEHISHYKIEQVIAEVNRVMKDDGVFYILTPDLKRIATAYVTNDIQAMDRFRIDKKGNKKDMSLNKTMGLGLSFIKYIVECGSDSLLMSNDFSEIIGGYSHVFLYDFKMLQGILKQYGFNHINEIKEDSISDYDKLREQIHFDVSLVVSCKKSKNVIYNKNNCMLFSKEYVQKRPLINKLLKINRYILKYLGGKKQWMVVFLNEIAYWLRTRNKKRVC